jgi:phosphohistidine swiveling domain-containing protein
MNEKFVKYITRDYSLRDRSLIVSALFKKGAIKQIFYTKVIEHRHDGLVDVYVIPKDLEAIQKRLLLAVKKDKHFIDNGLNKGIKVTAELLKICSKEPKVKNKKEALFELEKAKKSWQKFSSFLEFTHRVGNLGVELTEKELHELGKFHDARKEIFLKFFSYLDKICELATRGDKIVQVNFRLLLFDEIKLYLNGKLSVDKINELQSRRDEGYVYENFGSKERVIDENVDEYFELIKSKYLAIDDLKSLVGKPITKGIVSGEVKVVTQANFRNHELSGKIVVISMTTPEMNSKLHSAKAIITEEGGLLCHAAVFSREFGIITLTQVKNATSLLKDGDYIEVDANNGIVKKLS